MDPLSLINCHWWLRGVSVRHRVRLLVFVSLASVAEIMDLHFNQDGVLLSSVAKMKRIKLFLS